MDPTFPKASDVEHPQTLSLRDMIKEIFELIRSPQLDNFTILKRFVQIYQPQYRTEVRDFLRAMQRYSILEFNHPILKKQRYVIPMLIDALDLQIFKTR